VLARPDRRKWNRWLNRINSELAASATDRDVFRQWEAIVRGNPGLDINNRFMSFIWSAYFDRQVLVVRRQVQRNKQAVSLVRLLHEIADYSSHLTRRKFVSAYGRPESPRTLREGRRLFDGFAGRGQPHVSAARVRRDVDRLVRTSRGLNYLSDKWLAHSDVSRRWPRIGFRQLDRALDLLYSTWHRYHALVWGGPINADPKFLAGDDWQQVFDLPWR
jgi:hypothetical protein